MQIAFVGAGQMGMPMVVRLVKAGRNVTVFARRQEVRNDCAAAGAVASGDLGAVVCDADVVLVCLFSDTQVRELALGPNGFLAAAKQGATIALHTTGSPETAHALAASGADRDIRIVDAPVSGSAEDIAAGRLTVLLGGDAVDVSRVRDIVAAYSEPVLTLGSLGSAQIVKLLNNVLFAAHVQLAGEIERITTAIGVDIGLVAAAIQRSSGASYAMGLVEMMGSVEGLAQGAGPFLYKDVTTVRRVAAELDIDLGELGHVNDAGPLTFATRTT
jgi:3-hydroxyisobutyrate dehydrogenase-like beta-hydroxyacid dehydrogenase